jgi:hypothetical protein
MKSALVSIYVRKLKPLGGSSLDRSDHIDSEFHILGLVERKDPKPLLGVSV